MEQLELQDLVLMLVPMVLLALQDLVLTLVPTERQVQLVRLLAPMVLPELQDLVLMLVPTVRLVLLERLESLARLGMLLVLTPMMDLAQVLQNQTHQVDLRTSPRR